MTFSEKLMALIQDNDDQGIDTVLSALVAAATTITLQSGLTKHHAKDLIRNLMETSCRAIEEYDDF